jgi:hypothetical protein
MVAPKPGIYQPGVIRVNFKPGMDFSDIEKIVSQYPHTKTFGDKFDTSTDPLDRQLARSYIINTEPGKEDALIQEFKQKHGGSINYAERVPIRRPMGPC